MKSTVVIADDEPRLRELLKATLSLAWDRYAVVEAADGDEAWALIQEHRPALVLLDVGMPGRTGLEVTSAIRQDPELRGTKVILLTGLAQKSDIQAGLDAGANLYLTKPFLPKQLLTAIEQVLAS